MATIENIANAEICVSTFANPSKCTWLKLSDFDNAEQFLNEARQILGVAKSAELDFVDFSEINERMANDLDKYFELEKEFNELDETEQQALTAWLADDYCRYANNEASEIIKKFRNAYNGQWDSEEVRYETVRLMVADTARVTVTDTVRVADSVEVVVPITQRVYGDSLYRAYVSGYRPRLDSIFIYHPTTVVTGVQKPEKIAIFAGVGGTGICGGFSPSLGIGAVVGGKYAIGADVGYHKGMTYGVKLGIRIN